MCDYITKKKNPFNKIKHRTRFPNFKTYIRFGMHKNRINKIFNPGKIN